MKPKPLVFISHIGEESDVAIPFKSLIESSFLNLFEVFVSSDGVSIHMGQQWLQRVSTALQRCVVEIFVASPFSVLRPWVNFEAGAGWVRSIPVIPLCHSGMTPASLPVPMNMLHGALATDPTDLRQVFNVLATSLGATTPIVDVAPFISEVKNFELKYLYWDEVNRSFQRLHDHHNGLVAALTTNAGVRTQLVDAQITGIESACAFLAQNDVLSAQFRLASAYGPSGPSFLCEFARGKNFAATLGDRNFRQPR